MTVSEDKEKWKITTDAMMIIGKYFGMNEDYINVMRVCKKYRDLVKMYHFNPIQDCELFEKMESQHFYFNPNNKTQRRTSFNYFGKEREKEGMHQYIYWYAVEESMMVNDEKHKYKENILTNLGGGKYKVSSSVEVIKKNAF